MKIVIETAECDGRGFDVTVGEWFGEGLAKDEMLGCIAELVFGTPGAMPRYLKNAQQISREARADRARWMADRAAVKPGTPDDLVDVEFY